MYRVICDSKDRLMGEFEFRWTEAKGGLTYCLGVLFCGLQTEHAMTRMGGWTFYSARQHKPVTRFPLPQL